MKFCSEDQEIYDLCKKYGAEALEARRKFAGLLPEVYRRRIYEKKGFSSIFEFAARLAGMSQEQVRIVLNLERRLEDKPVLKNLLVSGEVSANKLVRVVAIATPENQENLAATVKLLSKNALEVFVKDEKFAVQQITATENQNASTQPLFEDKTLPGQTFCAKLNFQFSDEMIEKLNHLHAQGRNMDELLGEMLEARAKKIEEIKNEIADNIQPTKSRYIPMKIKKILKQEFGEKCSIWNCSRAASEIHHTQRFAVSRNHDPRFLAPFCPEHHQIAHTFDMKFHQVRIQRSG